MECQQNNLHAICDAAETVELQKASISCRKNLNITHARIDFVVSTK